MKLSISTSTLYNIPFETALNAYKAAGFANVELNMHWSGGDSWEVAQHLAHIAPEDAVMAIRKSGLLVASIHDCGGVIEEGRPSAINALLPRYLEALESRCPFIVFHPPHMKTNRGLSWWSEYSPIFLEDIERYRPHVDGLCIENLPDFEGYFVPLTRPDELRGFLETNDLFANLDSSHCAEMGIDPVQSAKKLGPRTKTVHLSGYSNGRMHTSLREGDFDTRAFIKALDGNSTEILTLEIIVPKELQSKTDQVIDFLTKEREHVELLLELDGLTAR